MREYEVVALERTAAPSADGLQWFRYVIANGVTTIEGMRCGTREEVFEHANRCAERLNTPLTSPVRW